MIILSPGNDAPSIYLGKEQNCPKLPEGATARAVDINILYDAAHLAGLRSRSAHTSVPSLLFTRRKATAWNHHLHTQSNSVV
jgi:hypothetical protein